LRKILLLLEAADALCSVLLAWGLTCIIFISLTAFTFQSKINFEFMGGFLSCGETPKQ
jgi:hypothetical protein